MVSKGKRFNIADIKKYPKGIAPALKQYIKANFNVFKIDTNHRVGRYLFWYSILGINNNDQNLSESEIVARAVWLTAGTWHNKRYKLVNPKFAKG